MSNIYDYLSRKSLDRQIRKNQKKIAKATAKDELAAAQAAAQVAAQAAAEGAATEFVNAGNAVALAEGAALNKADLIAADLANPGEVSNWVPDPRPETIARIKELFGPDLAQHYIDVFRRQREAVVRAEAAARAEAERAIAAEYNQGVHSDLETVFDSQRNEPAVRDTGEDSEPAWQEALLTAVFGEPAASADTTPSADATPSSDATPSADTATATSADTTPSAGEESPSEKSDSSISIPAGADEEDIYATEDGYMEVTFLYHYQSPNSYEDSCYWRIYILSDVNYFDRPEDAHSSHRFFDSELNKHYICIDPNPTSKLEAKNVSADWADLTARYIQTGINF